MRLFKNRDRRSASPDNIAKRELITTLKLQREMADRIMVEHQLSDSAQRADDVADRLSYLASAARVAKRRA